MTDNIDRAQRILEGKCPDCGKTLEEHTVICPTEHNNRLRRLKNAVVKNSLLDTMTKILDIKDNKNV